MASAATQILRFPRPATRRRRPGPANRETVRLALISLLATVSFVGLVNIAALFAAAAPAPMTGPLPG